jgi:RHS repeat-associated protein
MWTLHTDSGNSVYGGQNAKNIYLGDTRIVTKLASPRENTIHEEYYKQYYYYSDHLGSASLISDYKGDEYQRIEYTPYGETWVEKTQNTGLEYLPYKFTGQMKDEETGNYYIGARYLHPQTCRWLSCDPALSEYMAGTYTGCGGAYNSVNLNLYHYAGNNPITFVDPDGREDEVVIKPYEPTESKRQVDSASGSLLPSSNYTQHTANQNKEQKALWGEELLLMVQEKILVLCKPVYTVYLLN